MSDPTVRLRYLGTATDLVRATAQSTSAVRDFDRQVNTASRSVRNSSDSATKGLKRLTGSLTDEGERSGRSFVSSLANAAKNGIGAALSAGKEMGSSLVSGVKGGFEGLPPQLKAGVVLAGLAVAATAAPYAGLLIGGAIVTGFGAGLAGLGLMVAAKSPAVQAEFKKLTDYVSAEMTRISKPFEATLITIAQRAKELAPKFLGELDKGFPKLAESITAFSGWVKAALEQLLPVIQPMIDAFTTILKDLGPQLPGIFSDISDQLVKMADYVKANSAAFTGLINFMLRCVEAALFFVNVLIYQVGGIQQAISWIWNFSGALISGFANGVGNAISWLGRLFSEVASIPGRILSAVGNLGNLLWNAGSNLIGGFINGIVSRFNEVRRWLNSLTSMLPDWKGPASVDRQLLVNNGQMIMDSLINGFRSRETDVRSYLGGVTKGIGTAVSGGTATPPAIGSGGSSSGGATISFGSGIDQALAQLIMKLVRDGKIQLGRS